MLTKKLRKKLNELQKSPKNAEFKSAAEKEKFTEAVSSLELAIAATSSEEYPITAVCIHCDLEIGISKTPADKCPVCDRVVAACNVCKMDSCYECSGGSNFEAWETEVNYIFTSADDTKQYIRAKNFDDIFCRVDPRQFHKNGIVSICRPATGWEVRFD